MRALLYCAGGGIGDSLAASVVARALRQKYDVVDALTLTGHRPTLERVPDLDEVLVDEGKSERAMADALIERAYDLCIVTWATSRTVEWPPAGSAIANDGFLRSIAAGTAGRGTRRMPKRVRRSSPVP